MEINNIDYTIDYNTATGEKIFESRREETPIIKWIRYILYKELKKIKNKFKIIITVDTTKEILVVGQRRIEIVIQWEQSGDNVQMKQDKMGDIGEQANCR